MMLKRINKNKISKIILYSSLTISTSVNAYAAIVLKYFFNILVLGFVIGIGTAVFIDKIFTNTINVFQQSIKTFAMGQSPFMV